RRGVVVRFQISHQFADRRNNSIQTLFVEMAQSTVGFRKPQSFEQDSVTVFLKRRLLQAIMGLFCRLERISRQKPLVKQLRRFQRRSIAKHDFQELESLDMPSRDDEAYRERRRYDQSDRAPEPGPE